MDIADKQLVDKADVHNYQDTDLIELKTALHLPYFSGSNEYERVDGEIVVDGKHYNYVKRKVSNDTLYVMCLPNKAKTELYSSMLKFTEQTLDLTGPGKPQKPKLKKHNTLSDYNYSNSFAATLIVPALSCLQKNWRFSVDLLTVAVAPTSPPPRQRA
jgi:hypothetical protein